MKLVAEKKGPRDKYDNLRFVRSDGSETQCQMPRQGTLPHDLIHFVVESNLPLRHGFLSLIAAGSDAAFVLKMVHDTNSPDVKAEAVQIEAIVEAMQSQLWAGAFDDATFLEAARLAAAARGTPEFEFAGISPRMLHEKTLALLQTWSDIPYHEKLELTFGVG